MAQVIAKSGSKVIFSNVTIKNIREAIRLQDAIKDFLSSTKSSYSLGSKIDIEKMFKEFNNKYKIEYYILKEFGIIGGRSMAELLLKSHQILVDENWNLSKIKDFDETKRQKQYKRWKESEDYVEGKHFGESNCGVEERIMIVYDVNDPLNRENIFEYTLKGKVGKKTMDQVSMFKTDWHYQTGIKYYDARPILLENYLKKSEEELKRVVIVDID